ncbi:DUF3606 domain-containing protein [Sphingobacterium ginsenosidimutans]|uniref:DUF3606 domain-containing protein n=2 Tax=Sphingobacterium TaxID=28453 RepID=A0ABP7ZWG0_9SPHI
MGDNKDKRTKDRGKVALNEKYEVDYLAKELGVSPKEIEMAVEAVGNDRAKIEAFLKNEIVWYRI